MPIKRYTRTEMEQIWSDERKFQNWLDVEIAILEAKEELGLIPTGTALKARQNAKFTIEAIEEREKETGHDLMAFVRVFQKAFLRKLDRTSTPALLHMTLETQLWQPN